MKLRKPLSLCLLLVSTRTSSAQAVELSGHVKHQVTASDYRSDDLMTKLGQDLELSNSLDLRLNSQATRGNWTARVDFQMLGLGSNVLRARKDFLGVFGSGAELITRDRRRLFRLSLEAVDEEHVLDIFRLDRAYADWSNERLSFRIGRQAISWGHGLAFQTLDPFNPFSPTEIDKEYKTGDDMAYARYLFPSGGDVQLLVVPRRNFDSGSLSSDESSYAAKFYSPLGDGSIELDALIARHFGENLGGIGASGEVFDAVWRADVSIVGLERGGSAVSYLFNLDRSWTFFDKNLYGFLEFFHSGLGKADGNYSTFPKPLLDRILRGELYTLRKNYAALGLRFEATPLLNIYPTGIFNLDDESAFFQIRLDYNAFENLFFEVGAELPVGERETEFGGFELDEKNEGFVTSPKRLYAKTSWYF